MRTRFEARLIAAGMHFVEEMYVTTQIWPTFITGRS